MEDRGDLGKVMDDTFLLLATKSTKEFHRQHTKWYVPHRRDWSTNKKDVWSAA